jgi:hypothetical protein
MPVGTATRKVMNEKIIRAVSLMPLVNIWCPQTKYPTLAIAIADSMIATYPKTDLFEKTGITSLMTPIAGRIMIYTAGCE